MTRSLPRTALLAVLLACGLSACTNSPASGDSCGELYTYAENKHGAELRCVSHYNGDGTGTPDPEAMGACIWPDGSMTDVARNNLEHGLGSGHREGDLSYEEVCTLPDDFVWVQTGE